MTDRYLIRPRKSSPRRLFYISCLFLVVLPQLGWSDTGLLAPGNLQLWGSPPETPDAQEPPLPRQGVPAILDSYVRRQGLNNVTFEFDGERRRLDGTRSLRYQQKVNNIPVYSRITEVVVDDRKSPKIYGLTLTQTDENWIKRIPISYSISPSASLDIASSHYRSEVLSGRNTSRLSIRTLRDPSRYYYKRGQKFHLSWHLSIQGEIEEDGTTLTLVPWDYWIDAHNGEVLFSLSAASSAEGESTTGSGYSFFDNHIRRLNLYRERKNGKDRYVLRDATRRGSITIYRQDLRYIADNESDTFSSTDDHRIEVATLLNFGAVYDYFNTKLSWDSYDGSGAPINAVVHDSLQPRGASWSKREKVFRFGDGIKDRPLGADLDIVSHEYVHAVTDKLSLNAINRCLAHDLEGDEPGALYESIADLFAVLISIDENGFMSPTTWLVGEKVLGGETRDLGLNECASCSQQADHFGKKKNETCQENTDIAYFNSGIPNKAAFLLLHGGTHDGISVEKLEPKEVAELYYRTLGYLSFASNFVQAREWMIYTAGMMLDGRIKVCSVMNAWAAVGVGSRCR